MEWILPVGLICVGFAGLQVLLTWLLLRRNRSELRALRKLHVALAIHLVGEPLRRDPEFVRLIGSYRQTPRKLSQEDRVRARSWIRSAARVYGLVLGDDEPASNLSWGVPTMGESHVEGNSPDLPSIEELIDLDPEFLSFVDALRRT